MHRVVWLCRGVGCSILVGWEKAVNIRLSKNENFSSVDTLSRTDRKVLSLKSAIYKEIPINRHIKYKGF